MRAALSTGKARWLLLLSLGICAWASWDLLLLRGESDGVNSSLTPEEGWKEAEPTSSPSPEASSSSQPHGKEKGEEGAGGVETANRFRIDYFCTPHIALLPLVGYGGTEGSCEAEIEGLSKLYDLGCVEFVAVVPHRDTHGHNYSFPILEHGNVGDSPESFIKSYVDGLRQRDKAKWPQMIWCQSEWCPTTLRNLGIGIPVIATLHYGDCNGCRELGPSVHYRMPSAYVQRKSVGLQSWMSDRSFVVWQAFKDSEFQFSSKEGDYYLWTAACGWHKTKGMAEFQRLASDNPDKKFVVHCSGMTDESQTGELLRGKAHNDAFANAKGLFFWTHMTGETFGRVVVEALSKGTPVIGSATAANPELVIQNEGGFISNNLGELHQALSHNFDREAVYKTAQRFRSKFIVRQLLEETKRMLVSLREQSLITTNVDDFMVLNFTGYGTASANRCWQKAV